MQDDTQTDIVYQANEDTLVMLGLLTKTPPEGYTYMLIPFSLMTVLSFYAREHMIPYKIGRAVAEDFKRRLYETRSLDMNDPKKEQYYLTPEGLEWVMSIRENKPALWKATIDLIWIRKCGKGKTKEDGFLDNIKGIAGDPFLRVKHENKSKDLPYCIHIKKGYGEKTYTFPDKQTAQVAYMKLLNVVPVELLEVYRPLTKHDKKGNTWKDKRHVCLIKGFPLITGITTDRKV